MVSLGISPEYVLNEMSFEEMSYIFKAQNRRLYESSRLQCFFNLVAQGNKIKSPTDIVVFEWEKKNKGIKPRKLTEEQFEKKTKEAQQWLTKK